MSSIFREFPYNLIMKTFQTRLKEQRLLHKLSQKDLAKVLKTNNSSVCDWEKGRTEPDLDTLIRLSIIFDVTADYLLGLEDDFGCKINKSIVNSQIHNSKVSIK